MKAVVIKTKGKNATLLQDDGQFVLIKNHNYQVGEVIITNKQINRKRILALAASAAMIVMLLTAGVFAYTTPAYYVSLDVNPSLVMEINFFEQIIGIEAMNEEAKAVLAELEWKNKDVKEVLAMAVQIIEEEGYFVGGGNMLVAVAGKGEARKADLLAALQEKLDEMDLDDVMIDIESVGEEMVTEAKAFGLTPGKYNIIANLLSETVTDENVTEYLNLPINDLMARFTATKGLIGKETAESAKQLNTIESLPSEAQTGQQTADQLASEATQKASEVRETAGQTATEAAQQVTESSPNPTETLPANGGQPDETPPTSIEVEIPDAPVEITMPTLPTINAGRP
jgi:hypothetical protein